jgi:hypothetical protein
MDLDYENDIKFILDFELEDLDKILITNSINFNIKIKKESIKLKSDIIEMDLKKNNKHFNNDSKLF